MVWNRVQCDECQRFKCICDPEHRDALEREYETQRDIQIMEYEEETE